MVILGLKISDEIIGRSCFRIQAPRARKINDIEFLFNIFKNRNVAKISSILRCFKSPVVRH